MQFLIKYLLLWCVAASLQAASARPVTCPPVEQIKNVTFNHAELYNHELPIWELTSQPFMHNGEAWQISFGVWLPNIHDLSDAMRLGQAKFVAVCANINKPGTNTIPGYLSCDYTHHGMAYWIQARSSRTK